MTQSQDYGRQFEFNAIFKDEIKVINRRRAANNDPDRPKILLSPRTKPINNGRPRTEIEKDSTGTPVLFPPDSANLTGLSLSGGGVRSAAFCLGALQALHEAKVLDRVDYLSTVSGGGYIGCALTTALEKAGASHHFPFAVNDVEDETPSMQHVRDYSNYLFPRGSRDIFDSVAIYLRGLVANLVTIMPFLLIAAAITILCHPTVASLSQPNILRVPVGNIFPFQHFVVTAYLGLIFVILCIAWGWTRSTQPNQGHPEIDGSPRVDWEEMFHGIRGFARGLRQLLSTWPNRVALAATLVVIAAICELQQFVLAEMFQQRIAMLDGKATGLMAWLNSIAAVLAPLGTVIAFLGSKLAEFVKTSTESNRGRARFAGYTAKIAIYLAALIIPFLLWVIYLNLAYWGICINGTKPLCNPPWSVPRSVHVYLYVAAAYLALAAVLFFVARRLRPNANSLHPLYRDRLGKAFLFEPRERVSQEDQSQGLKRAELKLSQLTGKFGPYHLINAALNIQNSKLANSRGRNADFFIFSQLFVGSESTQYVETTDYDKLKVSIDLATAMAVSGAAASSNMGAQSIKPLTPTLALLNVRLGYWLRNPSHVKFAKPGEWNRWANFYFFYELIGRLDESKKSIYLTDGGHIENLGIYELLKRGCRVIIAVDAEADPEMAFGSFNTLVRYARIDLGIEIDLPWQQLTNRTKETNAEVEKTGDAEKHRGPHCAIGRIVYSWNQGRPDRTGILVYIKSSLTGDENDYVYHYKKRYWAFPHETTLDQMFSEEQFEAYRALGYHATNGLFTRRDDFAKCDDLDATLADADLLDALFPRATEARPGQKSRFADWLRAPATEAVLETG